MSPNDRGQASGSEHVMFVRTENPYAEGLCDRWVVGSCRIHQRLPSFFMCQMTYSNDGTCQRTRQWVRRDRAVNHCKSVKVWVIHREDGQGTAQRGTWIGQEVPVGGPADLQEVGNGGWKRPAPHPGKRDAGPDRGGFMRGAALMYHQKGASVRGRKPEGRYPLR